MLIIIICIILIIVILYKTTNENFDPSPSNSADIPPIGLNHPEYDNKSIIKDVESRPLKKFAFQSDQIVPVLKDEESLVLTNFIKQHFPKFLKIVRLKKEQQKNIKRYDTVFEIKDDTNSYHHIVLCKIIVENGQIFFNTIEYGGMVLPNEIPSKQGTYDDLFFINESKDKITFNDDAIKQEMSNFEKRKIEILLRRGRSAA